MKSILLTITIVIAAGLVYIGVQLASKQNRILSSRPAEVYEISSEKKTGISKPSIKISNKMLPKTPPEIPLTLWGTIIGPLNSYAVIEDHQTKSQALYKSGDSIQNTVIKKIFKNYIILRYNNQDYILKNDLLNTLKPQFTVKDSKTSIQIVQIRQSVIETLLTRTNELKRQISFKPVMREGKTEGLITYRILPNSIFYNLGLRNGDIIKTLNKTALTSLKDALDIYKTSDPEKLFKIQLLRKGKELKLVYQIIPDKISGAQKAE